MQCGPGCQPDHSPFANFFFEDRSHLGAWAVVSSPLVLSFDVGDAAVAGATVLDALGGSLFVRDGPAARGALRGALRSLFKRFVRGSVWGRGLSPSPQVPTQHATAIYIKQEQTEKAPSPP